VLFFMNTSGLHFSDPVLRLARRVALLPLAERLDVWAKYRAVRRQVLRHTVYARLAPLAGEMAQDVSPGPRYERLVLALRLARAYSRQTLAQAGAPSRAERALVDESFLLLHQRVRELLGLRPPRVHPEWRLNDDPLGPAWLAVCDGSHKQGASSVGVLVFDERMQRVAEISVRVPAASAVEAELCACRTALSTLAAFGARRARVLVDAQSVVCALRQTLPVHHGLHEGLLLRESRRFDALEVRQVSRIHTRGADRLAALLSKH
jgi:hypothetical protein